MSEAAIEVENLSKLYRISQLASQKTVRDAVHHGMRLVWRRLRWNTRPTREEFWALRGLNFKVQRGEVVGIIGRNGAGKSTLLKILSRITEPTTGKITLRGRIASLLEVGTGFHPDLTGRDNIYLNGAIHGLTRAEINGKFDQIVEFAEVSRFLDTPVKRYSSGMYVRLAFAVAAHLEPDTLVVDEVLAVGDAAFQKKCLGKIREVSTQEGRTVLFVSHNLASVRHLCSRSILLEQGRITFDGTPSEAIAAYTKPSGAKADYKHISGDGAARVTAIRLKGDGGEDAIYPVFGSVRIEIECEAKPATGAMEFFVLIYADDGECVAASFQTDGGARLPAGAGTRKATVAFKNPLAPGRYMVSAGIFDAYRQFHDWVEFAETFEVVPGFADGRAFDSRLGRISLEATWSQ
ncbi:MAG TPA: ABC transporter ATP-binding protein [Opitutaceae bacterium]|jgi:lipopolysaccharide transport system ATP-binding protein